MCFLCKPLIVGVISRAPGVKGLTIVSLLSIGCSSRCREVKITHEEQFKMAESLFAALQCYTFTIYGVNSSILRFKCNRLNVNFYYIFNRILLLSAILICRKFNCQFSYGLPYFLLIAHDLFTYRLALLNL